MDIPVHGKCDDPVTYLRECPQQKKNLQVTGRHLLVMVTEFHTMCRILTDPSQLMNNKVKLAWLEYFLLLVSLESCELSALLKMTSVIEKPAIISCLPQPLQDAARTTTYRQLVAVMEGNPLICHKLVQVTDYLATTTEGSTTFHNQISHSHPHQTTKKKQKSPSLSNLLTLNRPTTP
ncbi:uncharacterized protein [Dysidea avara]|uniref:uncharacterized protein isoform X2 n=1 Tax=Dysidea avara TaxID=196820 RepID=UPI00331B563D